jgi:hypothetical protein
MMLGFKIIVRDRGLRELFGLLREENIPIRQAQGRLLLAYILRATGPYVGKPYDTLFSGFAATDQFLQFRSLESERFISRLWYGGKNALFKLSMAKVLKAPPHYHLLGNSP